MKRRQLTWVFAFVLMVAIAVVGGYWQFHCSPRITQESFEQIQLGMSQREVETIIGVPPGNYGVGNPIVLDGPWSGRLGMASKAWYGDGFGIEVAYDQDGAVTAKTTIAFFRDKESYFDRAVIWLGIRKSPPPTILTVGFEY